MGSAVVFFLRAPITTAEHRFKQHDSLPPQTRTITKNCRAHVPPVCVLQLEVKAKPPIMCAVFTGIARKVRR